jgi:hypothetical protein
MNLPQFSHNLLLPGWKVRSCSSWLYAHYNSDHEFWIGSMDSPELAQWVAQLMNQALTQVVPLDKIVGSAPGPDLEGGIDLTDDEFASPSILE